jgi:hypothetical protein
MILRNRAGSKVRAMRFMTLVCFFHFSGLNNGFTFMAEHSGRLQGADFAPFILQKMAAPLRPSALKSVFSRRAWAVLLSRSGKVIEAASQRSVQNMLIESSLFQVWAGQCLKPGRSAASVSGPSLVSWTNRAGGHPVFDSAPSSVNAGLENDWLNGDRFYWSDLGRKSIRWKSVWITSSDREKRSVSLEKTASLGGVRENPGFRPRARKFLAFGDFGKNGEDSTSARAAVLHS